MYFSKLICCEEIGQVNLNNVKIKGLLGDSFSREWQSRRIEATSLKTELQYLMKEGQIKWKQLLITYGV